MSLNPQFNSDKKAMMAQIEAEQGDLSSYQRDLATASEAKSTKENELGVAQKKLADTQENKLQKLEDALVEQMLTSAKCAKL